MEDSRYLEEYHEKILHAFLPIMVAMATVCVFGVIGNAFTIAFYGFASRKSPTVYMITALAGVDLVVCFLIIPNIVEMGVNVKYTNVVACKVTHFFGHWTIEISGLLLWFISIDRYRHVCCPFKSQIGYKKAKWALITIVVASLLQSVRDFANFEIVEFPIPNAPENKTHMLGHYCTTTDDPKYKISVTLFHGLDALVVVIVLFTLAFTYGKIVWKLRHKGFTSNELKHDLYDQPQSSRNENAMLKDTQESPDANTTNETISDKLNNAKEQPSPSGVDCNYTTVKFRGVSRIKIKKTERPITIMMFAVYIAFVLCFIPYFVVKLGIRNIKSTSQLELGLGIQLVIRFIYVNSFANPFIYCIFNPQFRRYIKRIAIRGKSQTESTTTTGFSLGAETEHTRTSP